MRVSGCLRRKRSSAFEATDFDFLGMVLPVWPQPGELGVFRPGLQAAGAVRVYVTVVTCRESLRQE
jgi:hypothetical protein